MFTHVMESVWCKTMPYGIWTMLFNTFFLFVYIYLCFVSGTGEWYAEVKSNPIRYFRLSTFIFKWRQNLLQVIRYLWFQTQSDWYFWWHAISRKKVDGIIVAVNCLGRLLVLKKVICNKFRQLYFGKSRKSQIKLYQKPQVFHSHTKGTMYSIFSALSKIKIRFYLGFVV